MIHLALVAALAAPPAHDVEAIDATKTAAVREEKLAFCADPAKPFGPHQRATCATARELEGCQGLVDACNADLPTGDSDWLAKLLEVLAPIAHVLLYAMILVIVVAVAIPVVGGLLQLRKRQRRRQEESAKPNAARLMEPNDAPPPEETEPEEALRRAEDFLARGELRRALSFSLVASLGALGRRGAIRLGKHRTNGEYVRSCVDEAARPPLREIVRIVDAVEFGGAEATSEQAAQVTARARAIVRAAAVVAALTLLGCDPPKRGSDPAGDELPIAVLVRNGYTVHPLGSSLATLPVPEREDQGAPVVVIDTERVPLESETQAHVLRWVEAGGVLVLFGRASGWPSEVSAKEDVADVRDLEVDVPDPNDGLVDPESEEPADNAGRPVRFTARVGRRDAFSWTSADHQVLARLGRSTYAAKRRFGRGFILGVANDELWTNVGVMPKHNAAALVTLIRAVSHDMRRRHLAVDGALGDLRVARAEDGIPPPSNPFAALVAAGLGKGAWHALAAALLLFLCYGIRHARPRAAPGAPRRAFVEHVEATGAFYSRSPARSHALASYGRFVELRLREHAPRGTDPATFLASRTGADPAHVTQLLERAAEARTDELPRGDELDVIAELRTLLAKALTSPDLPRSAS